TRLRLELHVRVAGEVADRRSPAGRAVATGVARRVPGRRLVVAHAQQRVEDRVPTVEGLTLTDAELDVRGQHLHPFGHAARAAVRVPPGDEVADAPARLQLPQLHQIGH